MTRKRPERVVRNLLI